MATPDYLLLCEHATQSGPLLSMLNAGITQLAAELLPLLLPVTVVSRFYWDADELGQAQVVAIRVEHPDGERLANYETAVQPPTAETPLWHHRESRAQLINLALPLQVRRAAIYMVKVDVNGTTLMSSPLEVTTTLPQL